MSSKYWIAGHITAFFDIHDNFNSLLKKGSRGAGFSINRGVISEASINDSNTNKIFFNNMLQKPNTAKVTENVLKLMRPFIGDISLSISHTFEIPIRSGYGASAAGAIGTVFAIQNLFELEIHELDLWQIAHKAEILSNSGLGDVLGLYQSGFEFREKPGAPGIGITKSIPFDDSYDIYTLSLGKLSTESILGDERRREIINRIGNKIINKFGNSFDFHSFLKCASIFSEKAGLMTPELELIIKQIQNKNSGVTIAQIMIGNGIFLFSDKDVPLQDLDEYNFTQESLSTQVVKQLS